MVPLNISQPLLPRFRIHLSRFYTATGIFLPLPPILATCYKNNKLNSWRGLSGHTGTTRTTTSGTRLPTPSPPCWAWTFPLWARRWGSAALGSTAPGSPAGTWAGDSQLSRQCWCSGIIYVLRKSPDSTSEQKIMYKAVFHDPWHFGEDPDPRIHASD